MPLTTAVRSALAATIVLALAGCRMKTEEASNADGGTDAGTDGGTDAGTDAGADAGTDAGTDGGFDAGPPLGGDSVFMHHKNANRDGLYVQPALNKLAIGTLHQDTSFAPANIVGDVYAQPLFVDGQGGTDLVIVATENNNVYALDAATGATVWTRNVGDPVPLATLGTCGNIDPVGVTGTPVIDPATRTLFLSAEVIVTGSTTSHRVFALSVDDGSIRSGWPVDVPAVVASTGTFTANVQGQRGALAVLNGTVYIPYGGRYGDCGAYRGWVVGISIANPASVQAWVDSAKGGGIWTPGGISSDGTSLFAASGNTFSTGGTTWGGGDAFLSLSPGAALSLGGYFAPDNWYQLDNEDLDMGTAPIPFELAGATPSALAIFFGKDGNAYLVDRQTPGGVGAALGATAGACTATSTVQCSSLGRVATNQIISAATLYSTATATYVAVKGNGALCANGTSGDLLTLKVVPGAPPTLAPSWCGVTGSGSPMVTTSDGHADAIVWSLGAESDSRLHGFDGDTGAPILFTDSTTAFPGMRRYNTPIAAKGRIFVPVDGTNGGVIAFKP